MPTVSPGARISFRPSWSAICSDGRPSPCGQPAALLDHDGSLSWPSVECRRTSPVTGSQRAHCATLSGHSSRCLYGAHPSTLACQPEKAPGQISQNLLPRQRSFALSIGHSLASELQTHPKSGASWEGYVVEEVLKTVAPDEAIFGPPTTAQS